MNKHFLITSNMPGTMRGMRENLCFFQRRWGIIFAWPQISIPTLPVTRCLHLFCPADELILLQQLHKAEHWCALQDSVYQTTKTAGKWLSGPGVECHIFWISSVFQHEHGIPGFVGQMYLTYWVKLFIPKVKNNRTLPKAP